MNDRHLIIVGGSLDGQERVRKAREQQIDALAVDRSRIPSAHALPPSPPEADRVEGYLSDLRADATLSDRMEAWRYFAGLRGE